MWIEIVGKSIFSLINSDNICTIQCLGKNVITTFMGIEESVISDFPTEEIAKAFYDGNKLALNGMDFSYTCEDGTVITVKPLFVGKNRIMHEYMMQKEYEGDRT